MNIDDTGKSVQSVIFYDNDVEYVATYGKRLVEFTKQGKKEGAKVTGIYELADNHVRILFDPITGSKFGNMHVTSFEPGDIIRFD